jgi:hypothetical protein
MRPRACSSCGQRPVAYQEVSYCFDCHPLGPVAPPPCRRCGATDDYYSAGLCGRCHRGAPQRLTSCQDCLAWGVTRHTKWLCHGCTRWRRRYSLGACITCQRVVPLNRRTVCRLCWLQAAWDRRPHHVRDLGTAGIGGQQLWFANWQRMDGVTLDVPEPPPAPTPLVSSTHQQLVLLERPVDLEATLQQTIGTRPTSQLARALDQAALDHAARHGWSKTRTTAVRLALRVLVALQDEPIPQFKASQISALRTVHLPMGGVRAVLADVGMLDDDRPPAINAWFERKMASLPAPMVGELRVWFEVLRDGSAIPPRCRPRARNTITSRVYWALPTLGAWAQGGHESLREVSRAYVLATLPPGGTSRATTLAALRSIFKVLKSRMMVFTNPTRGIPIGSHEEHQPLPVDVVVARRLLQSSDPVQAALAALVTFHGLRANELRHLLLTDARDGRLLVGERQIVLADAVRLRLRAYLDYRNAQWPRTANPYLFIHYRTAIGEVPFGKRWLNLRLGTPAQLLREDRILEEAQATLGDCQRLSALFGLSTQAALRYTATVDHPGLATLEVQPPTLP